MPDLLMPVADIATQPQIILTLIPHPTLPGQTALHVGLVAWPGGWPGVVEVLGEACKFVAQQMAQAQAQQRVVLAQPIAHWEG